ncbi:MAG: baseplate J/gp47 family protein [Proteobacteria bacterium]|nr:baseplate J/gp47 family protein [Pseudomonadota bacterium]
MQSLVTDPALLARRRALVRQRDDLVGIDYIDVESIPNGQSNQPVTTYKLHVHFLGTGAGIDTLKREHIAIKPDLSAAITILDRQIPESGNAILTIQVAGVTATMGRYTLQLTRPDSASRSDSDAAPDGDAGPTFAPFFDRIDFRFDVDATAGPGRARSPETVATGDKTPPIDYRVRDYRGFRGLMLDRIAALIPDRQEHHPADTLTVLVEIIAHVSDQLSYYQDAVATEAYLGTARRRVSVRRHARLLGYFVHEGANARVWVAFGVSSTTGPVELARGTPILSDVRPARPTLSRGEYQRVLDMQSPVVFETMHEATLWPQANRMPLYTWGAREFALEAGATSAHLKGAFADVVDPGDVLILEEQGSQADPSSRRAHPIRLIAVESAIDPLGDNLDSPGSTALTRIEWHPADALPFRLVVAANGASERAFATGNVVLADHGRTIEREALPPAHASGTARYRPRLQRRNMTHAASYDHSRARSLPEPASQVMTTDPRDARPSIELTHDGQADQVWRPRRDLLDADGDTRAFVVELESDRVSWVRFGDGIYGSKPAARGYRAHYRIGNGLVGNIGARALAHVVTDTPGIESVTNPLPARGGVEPETIQQVRIQAPRAHRARIRATTPDDYAALARQFPGVGRAVASASRGRPVPIAIRVERIGRQPVDDPAFCASLLAHLEPARMIGHRLVILPARYLGIDLTITATTVPGYRASPVRNALAEAFSTLDLGAGRRGFFHPDRFDFGDELLATDLRRHALDILGVASVTVKARPWRFDDRTSIVEPGQVIRPQRDQIIRLDNDPGAAEFGVLTIDVREGESR